MELFQTGHEYSQSKPRYASAAPSAAFILCVPGAALFAPLAPEIKPMHKLPHAAIHESDAIYDEFRFIINHFCLGISPSMFAPAPYTASMKAWMRSRFPSMFAMSGAVMSKLLSSSGVRGGISFPIARHWEGGDINIECSHYLKASHFRSNSKNY